MTTDEIAVALLSSPTGGATALCIMRCKSTNFQNQHPALGTTYKKESRKFLFEIKKLKKYSEVS